jgi:methionine-rich copper-binding protein CopC
MRPLAVAVAALLLAVPDRPGTSEAHAALVSSPLAPGRYTVRYRVLSVDGHLVEAAFPFTVGTRPRPP